MAQFMHMYRSTDKILDEKKRNLSYVFLFVIFQDVKLTGFDKESKLGKDIMDFATKYKREVSPRPQIRSVFSFL